jgi:RNA polymerase sigma-70 factor (ECF subfamily)
MVSEKIPEDGPVDCSDRKVIHRLYEKMAKAAAWKAYTVVGRHDVAGEIAQEVFIKLWQGGGSFPNEKAVYAWIYKACHRAAIDHVRSATRRRESYVETYAEDVQTDELNQQEALINQEQVKRYIAELSDEEAEVFVYAVVDRMTQNEIAELTGKSRRTIQRIMARVETTYQEIRGKYDN